jgi:exodeoxyribonuclease-5
MTTSNIELTPAQASVAQSMIDFCRDGTKGSQAMATLSGYAGVGKTTVVAYVVDELSKIADEYMSVVVLAPTHKALSVLSEKLGGAEVATQTLQAALALKVRDMPDGQQETEDTGEPGSLRDYSLAIIDEASMVSAAMFATALFKRGRCKLLFVGDPAQLPPVDQARGTVTDRSQLGLQLSPAFGDEVPVHWKLTEVVRQAQDNPIIRLATAARQCIDEGREFTLHMMGQQLREGDEDFLAMQPGGVLEVARLVADAISHEQDTRALALDNNTVQAVNAHVHAMVHPGKGDYPAGTQLMAHDGFAGWDPESVGSAKWIKVPVRNSALLRVIDCEDERHPSELGRPAYKLTLEADGGGKLACWVAIDQKQWQADISEHFAEYRRLKMREKMAGGSEARAIKDQAREASAAGWELKARFAPLRYAYAMTVHKSQGSTFDAVVLAWDSFQKSRDIQVRNRLAYVALTRTRKFAVVCA